MKRRIFITFVTLILIGILTTGVLSLNLIRNNYVYIVKDKLISNYNLISQALIERENLDIQTLNDLAHSYSEKIDARVTFIDRGGWVVGDSEADYTQMENHKNRPEIIEAYEGKIGISQRYSNTLGWDMLYVAAPFSNEKSRLAVIRLAVPLRELSTFNKTLLKYIFISIVSGLIVAILLGIRYVNNVTQPISELTLATKKISEGDYGRRVYYQTDDELGMLANNFNLMSEKLDDTINELQDKNTKLKAILASTVNGVIALDNNKEIIFINPNAEEIFGIKEDDAKGKHILDVVRNDVFNKLFNDILKENKPSKGEIEIFEPKHRILNVYSNPIRLNNDPRRVIGVVLIIQEVTEIRKLERMRKDFVANVSHELKTPLTSIKGFIETLKDGAAENKKVRDKFLDIIDIETSRLTSLIQDLLLLSEIENQNTMKIYEEIDVNKSINEVLQIMDGIAKQKEIEIISKVEDNLPKIFGNNSWFKQMLINLIDNGIKYTSNGGKVTIKIYRNVNQLIIKIKDTGIGIEEKHLSRLFERFYRVDKARSRQVGGTGLGLAIVKHIVLAFEGEIKVESKINEGTEFTIILPI